MGPNHRPSQLPPAFRFSAADTTFHPSSINPSTASVKHNKAVTVVQRLDVRPTHEPGDFFQWFLPEEAACVVV